MSVKITHMAITIDGKTFAGELTEVTEPEEQQRLILSLSPLYPGNMVDSDFIERIDVMKSAFAKRFPDAPKFRETTQTFIESRDWKYFFTGATKEHIEWAKAAKDCGMIDAYIL